MIRPLWVEFPSSLDLFAIDDQFMVGSSLLVKPVTSAGQSTTEVVLPGEEAWYDAETHEEYASGKITMSTPLGKMPSFFRAGQIVPRRDRPRRNAILMQQDPFTLVVTVNKAGTATGELYLDDGKTFEHQQGRYTWRQFNFSNGKLQNSVHPSTQHGASFETAAMVERIIVLGLPTSPSTVRVGKTALESTYTAAKKQLVIRKPAVAINSDWTIEIQ